MQRLASILALSVLPASAAWACSTCMVGDPTQTLMGTEKPYENRFRLSLDVMSRDESVGRPGVDAIEMQELRTTFSAAWAPGRRMMLSIAVPLVDRQLDTATLAREEVNALGDTTLTVKTYMQQRESFVADMYGLLAGVRLPTSTEQRVNDVPLNFDVQPGTGATTFNAGGWYAHYRFPWLLYTSAAYHVATEGDQQFLAGDAVVLNASAQYGLSHRLAIPVGLEARWSDRDSFAGVTDPDSGGFIGFLSPGLIYTVSQDLLFNVAVKLPLIEQMNGLHEEGTIVTFGITYDVDMH